MVTFWMVFLGILCVDAIRKFTCLSDSVSPGGACEAAVIARSRCGWIKFRECGESL